MYFDIHLGFYIERQIVFFNSNIRQIDKCWFKLKHYVEGNKTSRNVFGQFPAIGESIYFKLVRSNGFSFDIKYSLPLNFIYY